MKIDKRSRAEMTNYLLDHFRYFTMNSWNRESSYAMNVKIYNLDMSDEAEERAYSIFCDDVDCSELNFRIQDIIHEFEIESGNRFTIGMNGRQGGYLVLYQASYEDCVLKAKFIGTDMYEDFSDWTMEELRMRVLDIQLFDKYCDMIIEFYKNTLENSKIVEEEILVKKINRWLDIAWI